MFLFFILTHRPLRQNLQFTNEERRIVHFYSISKYSSDGRIVRFKLSRLELFVLIQYIYKQLIITLIRMLCSIIFITQLEKNLFFFNLTHFTFPNDQSKFLLI